MEWKAVKRYPIPDEWRIYRSRARAAHETQGHRSSRYASHQCNAQLCLRHARKLSPHPSHCRCDDPSIGITNGNLIQLDRHTSVFDHKEPQRPVVDPSILKLIQDHTFSGADFLQQRNDVVQLNPRAIVTRMISNDYCPSFFNDKKIMSVQIYLDQLILNLLENPVEAIDKEYKSW